ncbi:ATPase [Paenibacillus larvae]|uniref:ATPase n=4 Tax=Paenibacillus larvae TaxID=1464 RepID=V9WAX5_9BACL|nr:hypothetical protein [Paenibacillus larvae]AHD06865.1 hypothetical protein ERIC2_c31100 [Paenibacillus larvae subsp. larvae DSM 25430]AQR76299.1 ATPase [Paenibacillus larvae subsp. larvae]AQT84371.1 ATPase [Paenibacillus larvae subsp. pulvifaciens]AQZ46360.1 ATPase [Paenibacillus larvae subsp. pulvifaciens]ARF67688.1 ATPase [Paenibacillus larvae subsp. pulvifaciens]
MLPLGEKVIIVADRFEQSLPIGEYGFIIAYDRNTDNVFDYVVRLPKVNKHVFVPDSDIELEEVLIRKEAERIEKESLLDFALATRNEELFNRILNGDAIEEIQEDAGQEVQSAEDFIKQVNLRAWI